MTRTHRFIFWAIGVIALATFLFGILQFVNLGESGSGIGQTNEAPAMDAMPGEP